MPNRNCSNCNKTYYQRPDAIRGDGKFYCCVGCRTIDQRTVLCSFCQKPFFPESNPKSPTGKNICCSQSCSMKYRWSNGSIKVKTPAPQIVAICEGCNTEFFPKHNRKKTRFCSPQCVRATVTRSVTTPRDVEDLIIQAYRSGKSQAEAGALYGYGRGATQKIFKRRGVTARTVSESLQGRVFSDEHRLKIAANHADVSGKNNPMYGRTGGNPNGWGIRTEFSGIKFRSTWETCIAEILFSAGITFEYEKHRIYLGDISTLIDFYLPSLDIYIEVKGRANDHFMEVLRQLQKLRPDINLLVIRQDDYLLLSKYAGHLLTLMYDKK